MATANEHKAVRPVRLRRAIWKASAVGVLLTGSTALLIPWGSNKAAEPRVASADIAPVGMSAAAAVRSSTESEHGLLRAAVVGGAADDAAAEGSCAVAAKPGDTTPAADHFEVGDKLKLMFYQRVEDVEQDKWGRSASSGTALQGFQQEPELSGDYIVQEDGKISLPFLGSFPLANRTANCLQWGVATAFKKLTGRPGFVTIMSRDRPPIYVLGPVMHPGSYTYVPGMTVLHAISLAGGFERKEPQPWEQLETTRAQIQQGSSVEATSHLLAQAAVLRAERDRVDANPPAQLVHLVGQARASVLLADELQRRQPIVAARREQEQSMEQSISAAQNEVRLLSQQVDPLQGIVKLRQQRADAMMDLLKQGVVNRVEAIQAESELADSAQKRQDAINKFALAQQQLSQLQQQQAKLVADTRSDLATALTAAEQKIADQTSQSAQSEGVLATLRATDVSFSPAAAAKTGYAIVRRTANGPTELPARGMSVLQPGDLVRIGASNETSTEAAPQPIDQHPDGAPPAINASAPTPDYPRAVHTADR